MRPISNDRFEELVQEALDDIPEPIATHMENVSVTVEAHAPSEIYRKLNLSRSAVVFGYYHGVPLPRRTRYYGGVLPDYIAIYREPIVAAAATEDEVITHVVRTVVHEIGHHFGFTDKQLRALGY